MDYENLLKLLDIESPDGLVYFEQFADLMEHEEDISQEAIAKLAGEMDPGVLAELVDGYFEDMLKSVPDGEGELYTLLTNIGTTLSTLAGENEGGGSGVFAEELHRFRTWYTSESAVICRNPADGGQAEIPLMEALANCRAQSFTDDGREYDFTDAMDYQLDEYIVSLDTLLEDGYGDADDYENGYGKDNDYRDIDEG